MNKPPEVEQWAWVRAVALVEMFDARSSIGCICPYEGIAKALMEAKTKQRKADMKQIRDFAQRITNQRER